MAVLIRHLGFWSLNGCRVLYSVGSLDDVARFGFAYGTLTNHAESGEELFEVFIDPQTDEVIYRIRAISWPQATLARIGQPIVRCFKDDSEIISRRDEARDTVQRCSRNERRMRRLTRRARGRAGSGLPHTRAGDRRPCSSVSGDARGPPLALMGQLHEHIGHDGRPRFALRGGAR